MLSRWSDQEAGEFVSRFAAEWGEDFALRMYASSLIGKEPALVLHGGGNCSVKTSRPDIFGAAVPVLYVKASGRDMASAEPGAYCGLDLDRLSRLRVLEDLSEDAMLNQYRAALLDCRSATPSIETLAHAFIPRKFIDHTHADAILTLTNQQGGRELVREVLGDQVPVVDYAPPGFNLARAAAEAYDRNPGAKAMVWMHHGLITWADTARESYESTVELITTAERAIEKRSRACPSRLPDSAIADALKRLDSIAAVIRGLLAVRRADADLPYDRVIVRPLITRDVLEFLAREGARQIACTPPLTSDHIIRTKPLPLWIADPACGDTQRLRMQLSEAIRGYAAEYLEYVSGNSGGKTVCPDPHPRVILIPGVGALCSGRDAVQAGITRDITEHTLAVKSRIATMGAYRTVAPADLFHMEYRSLQRAKLGEEAEPVLGRHTALITGAAGAIGSGVARQLLAAGCHVAVSDLPGERLSGLQSELESEYPHRVLGVPIDVTEADSVAEGFRSIARAWGGVDVVIINAGIAHVSALADMDAARFRLLERVNLEGTLHLLSEAARHFRQQNTGGDIVLISTKNVFAPGARFGAYSATKAGAHQLARIASQELADIDVRVNMVAPDAVFSSGSRPSGLWEEVGPERMKARGLDSAGLQEYYRSRNLLKARITAEHVARAVLFFITRQTPTTGATIPVDGGLPDATPR